MCKKVSTAHSFGPFAHPQTDGCQRARSTWHHRLGADPKVSAANRLLRRKDLVWKFFGSLRQLHHPDMAVRVEIIDELHQSAEFLHLLFRFGKWHIQIYERDHVHISLTTVAEVGLRDDAKWFEST